MQAFPTHGLLLLERRLKKFRQKIPEDVHDLRHTFISRLAESQASDSTVMALAAHVSRSMMERYSHIRMEAKRTALDAIAAQPSQPVFEVDVNQNVNQPAAGDSQASRKPLN